MISRGTETIHKRVERPTMSRMAQLASQPLQWAPRQWRSFMRTRNGHNASGRDRRRERHGDVGQSERLDPDRRQGRAHDDDDGDADAEQHDEEEREPKAL